MKNPIINIIQRIAEHIDDKLSKNITIEGEQTILYGENGVLDSLGLVNLIIAIEENIQDTYNVIISLSNERALSQKKSPFRTVGSLAEYIIVLLKEEGVSFEE